jgi:hypothetical protein
MTTARSLHLAAFATVAAVSALALTGCGPNDDTAGSTPSTGKTSSAAADPREVLLGAVPDDDAPAYKFKVAGNETPLSGVVDGSTRAAEINMAQKIEDVGVTLKMDIRVVDKQGWVKIAFSPANVGGLPKMPKKWMLLDPKKLDDTSMLDPGDRTDPGYTELLLENSAGLRSTSPGHYAGTTDLTKADEAEILDEAGLQALGEAAKKLPIEAVVDGGKLTSLIVKIPAAGKVKAHNYTVSYSGFGATPKLAAPAAGEQQKATTTAYEMLNG